jgi:hypothetical protein
MSVLGKALKDTGKKEGMRMIVAGQEGVGKTQFLCSSPKPILLAVEKGYSNVDAEKVTIVPIDSFEEYLSVLAELSELVSAGKMPFESIVTDSISALERMINEYVMRLDPVANNSLTGTMISAHGGFAKAHGIATKEWQKVIAWYDWFTLSGINTLMTCHVFSDVVKDTEYGIETPFNELLIYSPKKSNNYGARELLSQMCDTIGYLNVDSSNGRKIMLNTVMNNRDRAKNRYDIVNLIEIPKDNGWNEFANIVFENKANLPKYDYRSK